LYKRRKKKENIAKQLLNIQRLQDNNKQIVRMREREKKSGFGMSYNEHCSGQIAQMLV